MRNPEDKLPEGEIAVKSRFLGWLDNVWYHYKWYILIISFFLFVTVVCLVQCAGSESTDMTVAYAGGYTMSEAEQKALTGTLNAVLPEDYDGNGKKNTALTAYSVYTEAELTAMFTDEDGKFSRYNYEIAKGYNTDHYNSVTTYLQTGECAVWMVSEYVYEQKNIQTLAVPLSELYGTVPEGAFDGYAIRLADTDFYRYYGAVQFLPEDTLIVLTRDFVWGATSKEEIYARAVAMFRAIVEFKAP